MNQNKLPFRNSQIRIGIDNGHSTSKVLYYLVENNRLKYSVVRPEYICLSPENAPNLPNGGTVPENLAWIQYTKGGDCHLIGQLAKSYSSLMDFNSPKINSLIPKILAIVGAICLKEETSSVVAIDLIILTPWGEYPKINSHLEKLEKDIRKALQSFYFQGQKFLVSLNSFSLLPEASGLAIFDQLLDKNSQYKRHYYFMVGDKTASGLYFADGLIVPEFSMTCDLAFNDLAHKFLTLVPSLDKASLSRAISTKLVKTRTLTSNDTFVSSTQVDWESLVRDSDRRTAAELEQNFEIALNQFWLVMAQKLNATLPLGHHLHSVTRCGGTTDFLMPKLKQYFTNTALKTPSTVASSLVKALEIDRNHDLAVEFFRLNFPLRFADIWAAMLTLAGLFPLYWHEHDEIRQKAEIS
ncbi:MAG: ParM/StbA family protein [Prochloraceae cyanobacterium]